MKPYRGRKGAGNEKQTSKEFIRNSAFSAIQLPGEVMYSIHMNVNGKLLKRKNAEKAVELAEQDAEEEVNHYRKELEESKRREELARKVIDDQRKKIEALKARAADAFKEYMEQAHGGYLTSDLDNFIQKFNER